MIKDTSYPSKLERHAAKSKEIAGIGGSIDEKSKRCKAFHQSGINDCDQFKSSVTTTRAPYPIDWSGQ